jgi:hypothetical protein
MKNIRILLFFLVRIEGQANNLISTWTTQEDIEDIDGGLSFGGGITRTRVVDECNEHGYYKGQDFDTYRSFDSEYNNYMEPPPDGGQHAIDTFAAKKCKSSDSNPKLKYTSKDVCIFKFHSIKELEEIPDGYLSSACTDSNVVEKLKSYMIDDPPQERVVSWPDVCVGDYQRCYDIKRDHGILLRHICMSDESILQKELPDGTTHVSVDCREDKKKQLEWMKEFYSKLSSSSYKAKTDASVHEYYLFLFSMLMVVIMCFSVCMMLVHRYAVKPYLKAIKSTRLDSDSDSLNGDSELVPIRSRTAIGEPLI